MRELLKRKELRQLELVEYLSDHYHSIPISEVADALDYSKRTLKDDITDLNDFFDYLSIETSYEGIRIKFKQHTNLKTYYQSILERSKAFRLLELLITEKAIDTDYILETLSISLSTLYRLIKTINAALDQHFNIKIDQKNFQLLGSEKDIRYFYYAYFSERFPSYNWNLDAIDEEELDVALRSFIEVFNLPFNYSSYMVYKNILMVNFLRYRQDNKMPIEEKNDLINSKPNFSALPETILGLTLNSEAISQLFYNFIHTNYAKDYADLVVKIKTNNILTENMTWIENSLDELAAKYNIPIPNKNELILSIYNASYCERYTPRAGCLLYNYVHTEIHRFKKSFPDFLHDALDMLTQFRNTMELPVTQYTMDYLLYTFCVEWQELIFQLQNIFGKMTVLLISDRSPAHATFLKQIFEQSFPHQLEITTTIRPMLTEKDKQLVSYDLFIANFPLPNNDDPFKISVENTPTMKDLDKIRKAMNDYYKMHNRQSYFI